MDFVAEGSEESRERGEGEGGEAGEVLEREQVGGKRQVAQRRLLQQLRDTVADGPGALRGGLRGPDGPGGRLGAVEQRGEVVQLVSQQLFNRHVLRRGPEQIVVVSEQQVNRHLLCFSNTNATLL